MLRRNTLRILLTGISLMRTGVVRAELRELVQELPEAPAYLPDLMAAKAEAEHGALEGPSGERIAEDVARLRSALDEAEAVTDLPGETATEPALNDLLIRVRLSR
jgi:hypothetical protein